MGQNEKEKGAVEESEKALETHDQGRTVRADVGRRPSDQKDEDYPQDDNAVNPFLAFTSFEAISMMSTAKGLKTAQIDDINFVQGEIMTGHTFLVDVVKSCRVFQSKQVIKLMMKLDSQALKLFLYIVTHVGKDSDRIRIDMDKYMKLADISSPKTYYTAVNSLKQLGVIAKYKKNVFWVNPNVLFSGDRLRKYPDKVDVIRSVQK